MSHYAKVLNGKVISVIVAESDFFNTFVDSSAGEWIQTSYNTYGNQHPENKPLRGNFAGIDYIYDKNNDVFYAPQPYPSWTLSNSTWLWEAPTPYPTNGKKYVWDEVTTSWKEVA
jgi:hypothetical protein